MKRLAQLLRTKRETILERWRKAVIGDAAVPQAAELTAPALRDHVPNILDAIIAALESGLAGSEEHAGRELAEARMPRQHAEERFEEGYTLAALLRELSHLRAAIVDAYWDERDFDTRGVRFLHAALDECAAIAAVQLETAARQQLEEAVAVRERFVAVLSHDLRGPLNTVKMANGVMLTVTNPSDQQRDLVARSNRAVDRMSQMIEELLDFSKLRGNTLVLERAPVDMRALCEEIIEELRLAQPHRSIAFESTAEAVGSWDRVRVAQIVSNLVSNALTYSPPDSVVRVDVIADTEAIVVLVHNEGKAIPKDAQARIFEAFDRGAETNGHGLGLACTSRPTSRAHTAATSTCRARQGTERRLRCGCRAREAIQFATRARGLRDARPERRRGADQAARSSST
jgi:signal transduction histidine kinase